MSNEASRPPGGTKLRGIEDVLTSCGVAEATLSAAERIALDESGFVVLRRVVDETWLAAMRAAFERGDESHSSAGDAAQRGTRHVALSFTEPDFDGIYSHPRVLAGTYEVLERSFRVHQAGGRDPRPGFGQQGLHTDWMPRTPGEPYSVVTALWLLDDFTAENGATHVIPGSHRDPRPLPRSMQAPGHSHPDELTVAADAGDVLLLNGHLWHRATSNRASGPRRVLQCQFVVSEHASPDMERHELPERLSDVARYLLQGGGG